MTTTETIAAGGPAFPGNGYTDGMSLRDWFAGQVLAGFSTVSVTPGSPVPTAADAARFAYAVADAMLLARRPATPATRPPDVSAIDAE